MTVKKWIEKFKVLKIVFFLLLNGYIFDQKKMPAGLFAINI